MSLLTPIIRQKQTELTSGDYGAILFRIIEKGTQVELFKQTNREYLRPKLLFTWVLPDQMERVQGEPRPVLIHKEYTHSLRQSAHLYRDVIALRGADFTDQELNHPFDLLSLLGTPCILTISVNKSGEHTHKEVRAVKTIPTDTEISECPYDLYSLTFTDWRWELYDELSPRLQQELAKSPEFQQLPAR